MWGGSTHSQEQSTLPTQGWSPGRWKLGCGGGQVYKLEDGKLKKMDGDSLFLHDVGEAFTESGE